MGKDQDGIEALKQSILLKSNYKEGRFALGAGYKSLEEFEKAKEQFEYILKFIDSKDELTKKYLEEINSL